MKWFRIDSFPEAWRPVYRLSRLLSFTTMTYNFRDQTASRTSTDQTLLVVGVLIGVVGLYYTFTFYHGRIFTITNSHIISAGRFMVLVIVITMHVATMIFNYWNGVEIAQFPRTIQNIDRQISTLFKHSWNYQAEHLRSIIFIVIGFTEWFVTIHIMKYTSYPFETAEFIDGLFMTTTFNWVNFGCQSNTVSWLVTLATIRKRLFVLNHHMRASLLDDSTSQKDPHHLRKLILRIGVLHSQLSDTIDCFNSCHSTTVMFSFAPAFMFTVFSWFGLVHAYAANVEESLVPNAWATVTLSLNYISLMFYDVLFSVLVNDQVKQTAVIVHKCIGYRPYHRDVCCLLRKFSQQLWHHSPVISCGLFNFNWELIFTMIASLSTYVVILVQFDLVNYTQSASSTKH
uniref:gustatory receptor 50 n=1 Tax=Aedes aegypti TaxID=7159 RepID=UPI000C24AC76|nr:gustatory receptor 50 [Aedes aegypti]